MKALFSVKGLRVLVTGSTRGIGHAIAQAFAEHGAEVVVTGRAADKAEEAARRLGGGCWGSALDVSSLESMTALAASVRERMGGLDVLVNNAGIDPHYAALEDTSVASWHEILRTNLDGVFYACKAFSEHLLESRGSVINISSVAGRVALKRQVPYCASKGGVEQITRALAMDWAEKGVRVNGIGYGFIETDLTAKVTGHAHIAPKLLARTPMNRFGKLHEVAGAALFLASPSASFVTGHTVMVDGGWSCA
jgi:gluconate 5-dehydrogenase